LGQALTPPEQRASGLQEFVSFPQQPTSYCLANPSYVILQP